MNDRESAWNQLAGRLQRKINLAWWWQSLAAPWLISAITFSIIILFVRQSNPALIISPTIAIGLVLGLFIIHSLAAYLIAKKRFISRQECLVKLESNLELDNALTSAQMGLRDWPILPSAVPKLLRWNKLRILIPSAVAIITTCASFALPVSAKETNESDINEPRLWSQIETQLEEIKATQVAEDPYFTNIEEQLEKLRQQPKSDWFNHSSLEASDHLKQQMLSDANELKKSLSSGANQLQRMAEAKNQPAQQKAAADAMQQALQQMRKGKMQANQDLLKQLQGENQNGLQQLSKEQLEKLKEQWQQAAQDMQGALPGDDGDWKDQQWEAADGDQECDGCGKKGCDGESCEGGRGGVNRGPGTNKKLLGKEHQADEQGNRSPLKSDLSARSLPGDLLETSEIEHDKSAKPFSPSSSQQSQNSGEGGDRVWRDSLMPDEQKALKNFFE